MGTLPSSPSSPNQPSSSSSSRVLWILTCTWFLVALLGYVSQWNPLTASSSSSSNWLSAWLRFSQGPEGSHHSRTCNDVGRHIPLEELTGWSMLSEENKTCESDKFVHLNDSIVPKGHRRHITHDGNAFVISFKETSSSEFSLRKIPKLVHQTGKSRCITPTMTEASYMWMETLTDHSFYFHDDDAIDRLFHSRSWPEFPHLSAVSRCLRSGTAKADLWRLVILWEYGGIYADLDTAPGPLFVVNDTTVIQDEDDAFFVICGPYGVLSQYFMAATPKHPLFYFAVQLALSHLLALSDTGRLKPVVMTGPKVVHEAYQLFVKDHDPPLKIPQFQGVPFWTAASQVRGSGNRTVTYVGESTSNHTNLGERKKLNHRYVIQEVLNRPEKTAEYHEMGMQHFQEEEGGERTRLSCVQTIYNMFS